MTLSRSHSLNPCVAQMIPRQRLDISWGNVLYGIGQCFVPGNRNAAHARIGSLWSSPTDTVVSLSERTSFDLILETLDLPPGSEILVSALNIRPMFNIMERHGLVAVPIDLDMSTMGPKVDQMERAITKKTKAILCAQLFGSRVPMDDVVQVAKTHQLILFEDCAQAFDGTGYVGHAESDVAMFSFGPIKTCSTIVGGITRFKDETLAAKVTERQAKLPVQNRLAYLGLLIRFAVLITFSTRFLFSMVVWGSQRLGFNDKKLNDTIRVFGGKNQVKQFRHQPSYPVLALLERRLRRFDIHQIAKRREAAKAVIDQLPACTFRPGAKAPLNNYWAFPIKVSDPVGLMKHLRSQGYDSINGYTSFLLLDPPEGFEEFRATEASEVLADVLYLPVHTGLSPAELVRLGETVAEFEVSNHEAGAPARAAAGSFDARASNSHREPHLSVCPGDP